jgi:hypothetical protein
MQKDLTPHDKTTSEVYGTIVVSPHDTQELVWLILDAGNTQFKEPIVHRKTALKRVEWNQIDFMGHHSLHRFTECLKLVAILTQGKFFSNLVA